MENTSTDTRSNRARQTEVDYWAQIDRIDMELSGLPLKYHTSTEMSDSLGVEDNADYKLLHEIRKRLTKCCGNIDDNGQL